MSAGPLPGPALSPTISPTGAPSGNDPSAYLARIEGVMAALERDARRSAVRDAETAERRAASARKGDLGPDWQEVQRRVDAGQTSLLDVFGGQDQSPAARRLAELSRRNLAELGERLREQDDRLRAELADVADDLAWLGQPDVPPVPVEDASAAVRSATDPTAGVGVADGTGAPVPLRPPGPDRPAAPRDPVTDRVDATGLRPDTPDDEAGRGAVE